MGTTKVSIQRDVKLEVKCPADSAAVHHLQCLMQSNDGSQLLQLWKRLVDELGRKMHVHDHLDVLVSFLDGDRSTAHFYFEGVNHHRTALQESVVVIEIGRSQFKGEECSFEVLVAKIAKSFMLT